MATNGIWENVSVFETPSKEEAPNGVKSELANGTEENGPKETKEDKKDEEKKEEGVDVGQKCELKALEERYNKEGAVEVSELHAYKKGSKERFEDFALVTKQIYNKDQTLRTATLTVNSPHILSILREVVGVYATQPAGFDVPIVEEAPFALFYHYKDEIFAYEPKDEAVKEHHRLLMDWIDVEMSSVIKDVERLTSKGYIAFQLLWTIFKPGDLLFSSEHGHARLYKLNTVTYKEIANKGSMFEVNSRYVDYNGTTVGQAREKHQLFDKLIFTGKSPTKINTLEVFPRKFVDDDELEERLAIRGKRLLELKGILTMQYDGLLQWLKLPPYAWWGPVCERDGVWTAISITGRVVVDKKTFAEDFAEEADQIEEAAPSPDAQNAYLLSSSAYELEEDYTDPKLCPPFTIGYSLDRKVWCRLFIDQLQPIDWQPNPMDELILPNTQKKVLQALVGSHLFPAQARDEWGLKGKGLVILLHGTPGSGKTLTAETAAEFTKRALLKISLSELRDDDRLEENMLRFQRYASTWKAIVLIDEADVFLEARSSVEGKDSADRNGLVAMFLRTLEYFQGIIFLTSNRVNVFDQAIKSRVHLALQYSPPNMASRRQLWCNALKGLSGGSTDFVGGGEGEGRELEQVLDVVEKAEMNGREISNSIHTALTLARDEEKPLGRGHLETIIEVWGEFARQLGEGAERRDL
ncbi:hypothetical protein MMC30_002695 [Trapelia coarctata]|nr:hypothetical protein [Trapelia coarctata]